MLLLARGLRSRGHRQWIACPHGSGLESSAKEAGFQVLHLPPRDPGCVRASFALRRLLKGENLDIIHAHDGRGQSIAWLTSFGSDATRIASRRVTFLPALPILHRLKYQYTCDAVIAVSNYVKGLLLRCGVPDGMIEVIYDGIEIPEHLLSAEERTTARRRWGFAENDFVIGNLGPFRPEKGHDTAIQAASLLVSKQGKVKWLFATGSSSTETRGRSTGALLIPANVRVIPASEVLSEFFATIDLYVMPSLAEGLGSSALLAMAHGLPVAASRVGGLPEIVEDGKTGWLFPPASAQDLADVVVHALDNREELKRMGEAAHVKARQFSDDIMISQTEALYLKLRAGIKD